MSMAEYYGMVRTTYEVEQDKAKEAKQNNHAPMSAPKSSIPHTRKAKKK